jgi:hypothetical protein
MPPPAAESTPPPPAGSVPPPASPLPPAAASPAAASVQPASIGWRPPADRGGGRSASLIAGLILLAIGAWFFIDQTLGIDLPSIRWSQLWPLLLIGVGAWILLSAARRGSR